MTTPNIDLLLSDITFRRGWLAKMLEVTVYDGDDTRFDVVSIADLVDEIRALREERDAEAAVIEAAKAMVDVIAPPKDNNYNEYQAAAGELCVRVGVLRALEGDA